MLDFAQTIYDEAYISLYNLCYTSLPILALGLFDKVQYACQLDGLRQCLLFYLLSSLVQCHLEAQLDCL